MEHHRFMPRSIPHLLAFDTERAHQLIKSAPHSAEAREMLAAIKNTAKPLLHNDPITIDTPKKSEAQKSSMKHGDKVVPRKVAW
jgi:hypothetical protein